MVFCRHCGKPVGEGDLFCAHCGTPSPIPVPTAVQPAAVALTSAETKPPAKLGCVGRGCLVIVILFSGLLAWGWWLNETDHTPKVHMIGIVRIVGAGNSIVANGSCSGTGSFKNLKPGGFFFVVDGSNIESGFIQNAVYVGFGICQMTFVADIKEGDSYEFRVSGLPTITLTRSSMLVAGTDTLRPELTWGN